MRSLRVLLAVGVVLGGLVAFAPRPPSPKVVAGTFVAGSTDPANETFIVLRFWSDGMVDRTRIQAVPPFDNCSFFSVCGPPIVVIP